MRNITFGWKHTKNEAKIGNIAYGTVITGVSGNPGSIYMKIDKRSVGERLNVHYPPGYSVLTNLKTGALRVIRGEQYVKVLSEHLTLKEVVTVPLELLK